MGHDHVVEIDPAPQVGRDIRGTKRLYIGGALAAQAPGLDRPNSENALYVGAGARRKFERDFLHHR